MGIIHESELLSAAGSVCNAADRLRALGLQDLADQLEAFLAQLDVEIFLSSIARD
jgi:hypothetical protein